MISAELRWHHAVDALRALRFQAFNLSISPGRRIANRVSWLAIAENTLVVRAGRSGLRFVRDGRVRSVLSPAQLRLLLALEPHGEPVPIRHAARIIWPDQVGALTASQRASAARSITKLWQRGLVQQMTSGEPIGLTERGRGIVRARCSTPRPDRRP